MMHSTAQDNHHHQSMSVIGGVSQSLESAAVAATAADQSVVYQKVDRLKVEISLPPDRQAAHSPPPTMPRPKSSGTGE